MKLKYKGKTKDVYERNDGKLEFHFKDSATGTVVERKTVFDPGQDSVVGKMPGKGKISCAMATYFFKLLTKEGIPNHYIDTPQETVMVVEPAEFFVIQGLYNLEFVYRNNAYGSFLRRYSFVPFCKALGGLVEITTKGETDQLMTEEGLVRLKILSPKELNYTKELTRRIGRILTQEFRKKDLHLVDLKIELGKIGGKIMLIDDISPDVLRACRGAKIDKNGKNILDPLELAKEFKFSGQRI